MTDKEHIRILNDTIHYYSLLNEKRKLKEKLSTKQGTHDELQAIANRLEQIEDELFPIEDEKDIYGRLEHHYADINSSTDKKLYFLAGYATEDEQEHEYNYCLEFDKHLIYVPRDHKFNLNTIYYAIYWNIVDTRDTEIVCLQDRYDFEKDNYIIDDGTDIPYDSEEEYNKLMHFLEQGTTIDPIEEAYTKHRTDFFESLTKETTEERAIYQLVLKNKSQKNTNN